MGHLSEKFATLYGELVERIRVRGAGELAAFIRKTGWSRSTIYNPSKVENPRAAMEISVDRIMVVGREVGASDAEINRVIMAWFQARAEFGAFGAVVGMIFPALDAMPSKVRAILARIPEVPAEARDRITDMIRAHVEEIYKNAIDAYVEDTKKT